MATINEVFPSDALLWLEFGGQYINSAGKTVIDNLAERGDAPSTVQCGDGTTSTTFPTQLSGRRGVSFDGGDYINTGIVDPFEYNNSFTLFAALIPRFTSGGNIILSSEDINYASRGVQIDTNNGNTFRLVMANSQASSYIMAVSIPIVMGSLTTLVATSSGTGTAAGCNLYVNGGLGTKTIVADTLGNRTVKGGNSFLVGARRNSTNYVDTLGSGSQVFSVGIIPFALSPLQISNLHKKIMRRINTP